MELLLERILLTEKRTVGQIFVMDKNYPTGQFWFCYTMEDTVREPFVKIPKETAIQSGRYEVVVSFSERFKKYLPLLLDVPHFTGIRIHGGNTEKDTEGCIIVGDTYSGSAIHGGRDIVVPILVNKINEVNKYEKTWIRITRGIGKSLYTPKPIG